MYLACHRRSPWYLVVDPVGTNGDIGFPCMYVSGRLPGAPGGLLGAGGSHLGAPGSRPPPTYLNYQFGAKSQESEHSSASEPLSGGWILQLCVY